VQDAHGVLDWQSADLEQLAIDRSTEAADTVLVAALKRAHAEASDRQKPVAGFDNNL
jgi:hypothetical protein